METKKKSPTGGQTSGTADAKASKKSTNSIEENAANVKAAAPKKPDAKSREWWCCVYPDSAPSNWRELVQQTFLEAYISPLHDKDLNTDGTPKKPHWHVVLAWPGPTTFSNAKTIMAEFNGVIEPKIIGTLRGVCRYLCHLDNPEKAQYSPDDVICYNGADWETVINLKSDKYIAIEEMQAWCDHYRVTSFAVLCAYARAHRKADWFRCLCDNGGYIMQSYCKSLEWYLSQGAAMPSIEQIDEMLAAIDAGASPTTGEVLEEVISDE